VLTADLVDVRRTGNELELGRIDGKKRLRLVAIGKSVLDAVRGAEGKTRADVEAELAAIEIGAREHKMKDALAKLVLDECEWNEADAEEAEAIRKAVFVRATEARRTGTFDRAELLQEAGLAADAELFPDLREAARILRAPTWNAETLFGVWERARAQAILLRATKVRVAMRSSSASQTRALFRSIKFLGLLYTLKTLEDGSHLLEVDGPFSLFESVTKYGLKLALLVPILDACEAYALEAEVRWGKERESLQFKMFGGSNTALGEQPSEHADLIDALKKLGLDARPSTTILDLPGIGTCIPDLDVNGAHVEILGFWSRDAVWKRVELVEKGLTPPIVFAVSARLRVSEDVLPDDALAALYVYKGAISPRALAAKIQAVLAR
jgi:predicted nuclease of restriction endonuclease-like RecB superfamily